MHSLVALRLLPVALLKPQCIVCTEWEMLFASSQPEGSRAAWFSMLSLDRQGAFILQIQAATGTSLANLTQDSFQMAIFLRRALQAVSTWNEANQYYLRWQNNT